MSRHVRIDRTDLGPRLYVRGHRLHHGLTGMIMTVFGFVLMVHDWHDARVWLSDAIRPTP